MEGHNLLSSKIDTPANDDMMDLRVRRKSVYSVTRSVESLIVGIDELGSANLATSVAPVVVDLI